ARGRHDARAVRHVGPRRDGAPAPRGDAEGPRRGARPERVRDDRGAAPRVPFDRPDPARAVPRPLHESEGSREAARRGRRSREVPMSSKLRVFAPAALLFAVLIVPFAAVPGETTKAWVCAPCDLPCDDEVFDHPGTCPKCGMALIDREAAKAAAAKAPHRRKVAMLVFDGVEIIDYTGPWEVFGAADFEVFAVGETKEPVTTAMG